jgi:hypothetical protein
MKQSGRGLVEVLSWHLSADRGKPRKISLRLTGSLPTLKVSTSQIKVYRNTVTPTCFIPLETYKQEVGGRITLNCIHARVLEC